MKKSLKEIVNIIDNAEVEIITSRRGNVYNVQKVDENIGKDLCDRSYCVNVQLHKVNDKILKDVCIWKKDLKRNYFLIEK